MNEELSTKKCHGCGRELPIGSFHKNSQNKDGLQNICKECKETRRKANIAKRERELTSQGLSSYTPRELMLELKKRGFEGKLTYTQVLTVDVGTIQ